MALTCSALPLLVSYVKLIQMSCSEHTFEDKHHTIQNELLLLREPGCRVSWEWRMRLFHCLDLDKGEYLSEAVWDQRLGQSSPPPALFGGPQSGLYNYSPTRCITLFVKDALLTLIAMTLTSLVTDLTDTILMSATVFARLSEKGGRQRCHTTLP